MAELANPHKAKEIKDGATMAVLSTNVPIAVENSKLAL